MASFVMDNLETLQLLFIIQTPGLWTAVVTESYYAHLENMDRTISAMAMYI